MPHRRDPLPIEVLLQAGGARSGPLAAGAWALMGGAVLLLPALLLRWGSGVFSYYEGWLQGSTVAVMVAVAVRLAARDVGRLVSLRRGRAVEEILQSLPSARRFADDAAWAAGGRVVRDGLPTVAVVAGVAWLLAPQLALLLVLEVAFWINAAWLATLGAVYFLARGLAHDGTPRPAARAVPFRPFLSAHPVLYREFVGRARARRVPLGFLAAVGAALALLALPGPDPAAAGLVAALAAAAAAALRTMDSALREREQRTEEILLGTSLRSADVAFGRVAAVTLWGWLEILLTATILAAGGQAAALPVGETVLLAMGLALAPVSGGWMGLWAAARGTRAEGLARLTGVAATGAGLGVLALACVRALPILGGGSLPGRWQAVAPLVVTFGVLAAMPLVLRFGARAGRSVLPGLAACAAGAAAVGLVQGLHGLVWIACLVWSPRSALEDAGLLVLLLAPAALLACLAAGGLGSALARSRWGRVGSAAGMGALAGAGAWAILLALRLLDRHGAMPQLSLLLPYDLVPEAFLPALVLGGGGAALLALLAPETSEGRPPSLRAGTRRFAWLAVATVAPVMAAAVLCMPPPDRTGFLEGPAAPTLTVREIIGAEEVDRIVVLAGGNVPETLQEVLDIRVDDPPTAAQAAAASQVLDGLDFLAEQLRWDEPAQTCRIRALAVRAEDRFLERGLLEPGSVNPVRAYTLVWNAWAFPGSDEEHLWPLSHEEYRAVLQGTDDFSPPARLLPEGLRSLGRREVRDLQDAQAWDGPLSREYSWLGARWAAERERRLVARDAFLAAGWGARSLETWEPLSQPPIRATGLLGERMTGPSVASAARNLRLRESVVQAARAVAALQLHRLDTGRYPDRLADLVPRHLPSEPRSPLSPTGRFSYGPVITGKCACSTPDVRLTDAGTEPGPYAVDLYLHEDGTLERGYSAVGEQLDRLGDPLDPRP